MNISFLCKFKNRFKSAVKNMRPMGNLPTNQPTRINRKDLRFTLHLKFILSQRCTRANVSNKLKQSMTTENYTAISRTRSQFLRTLPITKMLESLVAKLLPVLSFTCTTSKEPGCLSRLVMTPIRPKLAPPVTMHRLPTHRKSMSLT